MKFSSRIGGEPGPSRLASLIAARRDAGAPILDLTVSNPTAVGLDYPYRDIGAALAVGAESPYAPQPLGDAEARAAVADHYRLLGADIDPARITLTASTSESYGLLIKLLCGPADAVMTPVPSYPLVEHLARAEAVELRPFRLPADGGFRFDAACLEAAIDDRCRAILLASPNNPTGTALAAADRPALADIAEAHELAVIEDAVFADYPAAPGAIDPPALSTDGPLWFLLGGLSRASGMPQLKLGWIAVGGRPDRAAAAMARLEVLADSYLSVATPVQRALPRLLAIGRGVRGQIADRIDRNRRVLGGLVAPMPRTRLTASDGGWYAVLELPTGVGEEDLCALLIERDGVVVQPGFFFDFERDGYIVVSLLPQPEVFDAGIAAIDHYVRTATT